MIETWSYLPLTLLLVSPCSLRASGPSVEERNGNIYFRDDTTGTLQKVTDSRRDRSPALSPDGGRIVFVRDLLGDPDYSDFTRAGPPARVMQLWVANVADGDHLRLILDSPTEVQGRQFSGFYSPQFSADGKYIYFQVQFSGISGAVMHLPAGGGQPAYVIDAMAFAVVPVGTYKGDLVVEQHRRKLGTGYYDWFYLLDPNAREIGVIGQDKDDVYDFVSAYVGDPTACPRWGGPEWMTCINAAR